MASPFAVFRRHQKVLLATLGMAAMVAFVVLPVLLQASRGRSLKNPVAVHTERYGDLTELQLRNMVQRRGRLLGILEDFLRAAMGQPGVKLDMSRLFGPAEEESVVDGWLLAREADRLGVVISDATINTFLRELTSDRLKVEDMKKILRRYDVEQWEFFNMLGEELKARQMRGMFLSSTNAVPPAQRWDYYLRVHRKASVELIPLPVESLVDQVADPEPEVLEEFFEKHKERLPEPYSPEPGFRLPHRVDLEYFVADIDEFIEAGGVSEAEVEEEYRLHAQEYQAPTRPSPTTPATESDTTPGGEEPTGSSGGAEPSAPQQPSTSEASSQPAEGGESGNAEPGQAEPGQSSAPVPASAEQGEQTSPGPEASGSSAGQEPGAAEGSSSMLVPHGTPGGSPFRLVSMAAEPSAAEEAGMSAELDAAAGSGSEGSQASAESSGEWPAERSAEPADAAGADADEPSVARGEREAASGGQDASDAEPAGAAPSEAETGSATQPGDQAGKPSAESEQPSQSDSSAAEPSEPQPAEPTEPGQSEPGGESSASSGQLIPEPPERPGEKEQTMRMIRQKLAAQKIREIYEQLTGVLRPYGDELALYEAERELFPDRQAPERPDFAKLAAQHGLKSGRTGLVSAWELRQLDIGGAWVLEGAVPTFEPNTQVANRVFEGLLDFRPLQAMDASGRLYLFWKVAEKESRVPELKEVRDRVLHSWKMIKARTLALERANALAEEARKRGMSLAAAFADRPEIKVLTPKPFSWLTVWGATATEPIPRYYLSSVEGVESPGEEFMRAVFNLPEGGIGTAFNAPKTVVYVIRVEEYAPSETVLWEGFLADNFSRYVGAAEMEQQQMVARWLDSVHEAAGLEWKRPPVRKSAR